MHVDPPNRLFRETFAITLPDGTRYDGFLYGTVSRRCGRQIVVKDAQGNVLFDTDECYDLGNATARLADWIAVGIKNLAGD